MTKTLATTSTRRWALALGLGLVAALGSTEARAQSVTFAQFKEADGSPQGVFKFSNNGSGSALTVTSAPVVFDFLNGIPGVPVGDQAATLSMITPADGPATIGGKFIDQALGFGVISFIRNSDHANLLTVTFTGDLTGKAGGHGASIDAGSSVGDTVNFSSQFLDFSKTSARTLALSLSGIDPALAINGNGYLNSFAGDGTGTFSSIPAPLPATVPQPASLVLLGLGLLGVPAYRAARRKATPVVA